MQLFHVVVPSKFHTWPVHKRYAPTRAPVVRSWDITETPKFVTLY